MKLKPYPKYKDSGVEWIGKIPEGWEIKRIKDYLNFQIGGTPSTSREDYFEGENVWVSIEDLNNQYIIKDSKKKISDEAIIHSNVKKVQKGSLLFSFKLTIGLTAFAGCDLYTNEAIAAFSPNDKVDLNFLKYVLQNNFENNAFENIYRAKLFNTSLLKVAKYALPENINEQKKIAKYLDKKTSEIDLKIEKYTQLIELLEEKKAALINHAVTQGLDPEVPMKDSGVEWIGEIPEGWEVKKLKFTSEINKKSLSENEDPNYEFHYLDISNVSKNGKILNTKLIKFCDAPSRARRVPEKKDTIISTVRTYLRAIAYLEDIPTNFVVSTGFTVLNPRKFIYPKYLYYVVSSELFVQTIVAHSTGIAYPAINSSDLANIHICYPIIEEQKKIAKYLDRETEKIDKIIIKIKSIIKLLKEYRESLIHHVVTGKVDVRDVV